MEWNQLARRVVVLSVLAGVPAVAAAAPVSWTGGGDGVTWGDPANWSGGVVPGVADDVTVSVAANPAIVVAGNVAIRSLNNAETITINSGVSFAVSTTASSTQTITLSGATIAGGAWSFSAPGAFVGAASSSSTISGAAINGDVVMAGAASRVRMLAGSTFSAVRLRAATTSVAFEPGATVTGQVIAEGASGSCFVECTAVGTVTLAPGAAIGIAPGSGMTLGVIQGFWFGSGSLDLRGTLFNAGGVNASLNVRPRTLSIGATGRVENTGLGDTTLDVAQAPLSWTNNGTLAVSSGLMTLKAAWTNAGTMSVSGTGRLDLDGSFTSGAIGTLARSGGTIAVRGDWDNAAGYTLNASTGTFLLQGGTITGGALNLAGGSVLDITAADNQLNGVAYGGELVLAEASERVRLSGGTTVAAVRLQGATTSVGFSAGAVVNFPIIVEGSASGSRFVEVVAPSGPLTIGPSGSVQMLGTFTNGTVSIGQGFWFGSATAVTNNGTISGAGVAGQTSRGVVVRGSSFANNGSVSVTGGCELTVSPSGTTTNSGSISASTGTLTMQSAWSSTGTISGVNAAVELDGSFGSSSAATVSRTGGTVTVLGVWDNTGSVFAMTPARGDWLLRGGTVRGGTLDFDGARLVLASGDNILDGVTFLDEVVLDQPSARARMLGATTGPGFRLRGNTTSLGFGAGFTLNFPVVADLASPGSCYLEGSGSGISWTIGPAGSVSTAPSNLGSVNLGSSFWFGRAASITNQGSISMSTANRTFAVDPTAFTNSGTISLSGGTMEIRTAQGTLSNLQLSGSGSLMTVNGSYTLAGALNIAAGTTLSLEGTWGNSGAIALSGTLNLGGAFTLATLGGFTNTGGTVNITGALDNTGGTLALTPATGSWRLAGGSVTGGQVTQTGGARLLVGNDSGNLLSGVQFPEDLVLSETNARVRIAGSTSAAVYRLSSPGASVAFAPGTVMSTTIIVDGPAGSRFVETTAAGALTIGPAGRVLCTTPSTTLNFSSQWFSNPSVTNLGLIEKTGAGTVAFSSCASVDPATHTLTGGVWRMLNSASLSLGREVWVNNAAVEFTGTGSLGDLSTLRENNGSFTLDDNRDAALPAGASGVQNFTNRGLLKLGAGSRLQLGNASEPATFTQTASGTLEVELGGNDPQTGFGSLRVFGNAALDGTIRAGYVNGFARACGQVFQFLDANARSGQFAATDLPPPTDETLFLLFYGGADARFSVSARADFNQDGFLDFFDYDDFVACFEGTFCPPGVTADFNLDEFVDFFDYDDFVFRFEAGC